MRLITINYSQTCDWLVLFFNRFSALVTVFHFALCFCVSLSALSDSLSWLHLQVRRTFLSSRWSITQQEKRNTPNKSWAIETEMYCCSTAMLFFTWETWYLWRFEFPRLFLVQTKSSMSCVLRVWSRNAASWRHGCIFNLGWRAKGGRRNSILKLLKAVSCVLNMWAEQFVILS